MEWSDFLGEKFGDRFYPYWMVSQMANELWNFGIQRDPDAIIFVIIFFLIIRAVHSNKVEDKFIR